MNLLEAARSGLRIKRRHHTGWVEIATSLTDNHGIFYKDDFFAEDWEVESEPEQIIAISRSYFYQKISEIIKEECAYPLNKVNAEYLITVCKDLGSKLGFK